MTAQSAPSTTLPAWAQAAYERQLAMLDRLAGTGMKISDLIDHEAEAEAAEQTRPTPEALKAFALFPRIARSVRQTLMLQDRIIRRLLGEEPKASKASKPEAPPHEPIYFTRRVSISPHPSDNEPPNYWDRLTQDGRERMDRLEQEGLDAGLSPARIIILICEDLGLDPDWSRRAEEAWASGEFARSLPRWPLAGLKCDDPANAARDPPKGLSP